MQDHYPTGKTVEDLRLVADRWAMPNHAAICYPDKVGRNTIQEKRENMGAFRKACCAFCLGLLTIIPTSVVSKWVMVEPDQDYYIDLANLQRHGETVTYWGKYKVLPNYIQQLTEESTILQEADYLVERNQINCKQKTIRFVRDTIYNTNDQAIVIQDYPTWWHPILPNTVAEEEWQFVCYPPPLPIFYSQIENGI
jgi:hypothetical protein